MEIVTIYFKHGYYQQIPILPQDWVHLESAYTDYISQDTKGGVFRYGEGSAQNKILLDFNNISHLVYSFEANQATAVATRI